MFGGHAKNPHLAGVQQAAYPKSAKNEDAVEAGATLGAWLRPCQTPRESET